MSLVSGKVAIIGHSYVARLQDAIRTKEKFKSNLGLTGIQTRFWGPPGARVFDLFDLTDQILYSNFRPNVVIIQIGSNDLRFQAFKLEEFVGLYISAVESLEKTGVDKVIIMKVFPRLRLRHVTPTEYRARRALVNWTLAKESSEGNRIFAVRRRILSPLLLGDGVHLSKVGLRRYYFEIKWLVVRALRAN